MWLRHHRIVQERYAYKKVHLHTYIYTPTNAQKTNTSTVIFGKGTYMHIGFDEIDLLRRQPYSKQKIHQVNTPENMVIVVTLLIRT